ncbi:bifunctional 4-hydroxy-2-oxoglutarate aldolase/2-dehydro-3-deoxy-phosphogluconate aldolase [Salinibacterium sp. G-O1]|uniref:bifunctional 4-hydroxy-2-oxoglutarate aldolase/2-dehydro-3-deoxy-phosphogluconate aldolase n=1 Tax=Salinibacterium sp. G-O1 TaxID=3046208 RepID=UPI0024BB6558|nr:bifunctional 4-hydroxy-2-oxoglutarate aldolase/2-dehydro-3-deoxy-phosphogluconate aldolase [Salinibacterium sp. G-O1]MDJ0336087.1 bifunctional 4-hydroxy-2-oxoglutarate aldolase/2-dehydro-3-deoxy-phosphogluconate aldolase [Salinibacterium sp. G-O1]
MVESLVRGNVRVIEVSLTTPDAEDTIARYRSDNSTAYILGAGTVLSADDARRAHSAGAAFVVTPALCPAIEVARELGMQVFAGAVTPTEVFEAHRRGATAVKLFPANWGGSGLLRQLRAPFPDISFVPVGGIDAASVADYLSAGATAVGVGSPLVGSGAARLDSVEIHRRLNEYRAAVADFGHDE